MDQILHVVDTTPFYRAGGNLQENSPSYVERQADTDLYEGLKAGKFCYVLTSRQMGKSSLGGRAIARLRQQKAAVVMFEVVGIGRNVDVEQWYFGLLDKIGYFLDLQEPRGVRNALHDFWNVNERLSPLQRCMQALREVVLNKWLDQVVIVLDEIENIRALPFQVDELFAAIRELYNRRAQDPELKRLTFCLIGSATPSDLIKDTRLTPFNIGLRVDLNDFTATEALPLKVGLKRDSQVAELLLKRILYWTDGHPYLTQKLCEEVVKDTTVVDAEGVDRLCETWFFSPAAQERDDNLIFVRERILNSEDRAGVLRLYEQIHKQKPKRTGRISRFLSSFLDLYSIQPRQAVRNDDSDRLLDVLKLSGVVKVEDGFLRVRNRIYYRAFDSKWINNNMPGAELRRVRAAYKLGIFRTAVTAAILILLLASLAAAFVMRNQSLQALQAKAQVERELADARKEKGQLTMANAMATSNLLLATSEFAAVKSQLVDIRAEAADATTQLAQANKNLDSALEKEDAAKENLSHVLNQAAIASKQAAEAIKNQGRLELLNDDKVSALKHLGEAYSLEATEKNNSPSLRFLLARALPESVVEPVPFVGHTGNITSATFSPDGNYLLTYSEDFSAVVWDKSGNHLCVLAHADQVKKAIFSPNGRLILTVSGDHTAKSWAFSGDKCTQLSLLSSEKPVDDVAFDSTGQSIATASNDSVKIWDVTTGRLKDTLPVPGPVTAVEFSPDDSFFKVSGPGKGSAILSLETKRLVEFPTAISMKANPSQKGIFVVVIDQNHEVQFETFGSRSDIHLPLRGVIPGFSAAFMNLSANGKQLVLINAKAGETRASIFDMKTGLIPLQKPHRRRINYAAFNSDGSLVVTASDDGSARIWEAGTGTLLATLDDKSKEKILAADFSPDGSRVVTRSTTSVKSWNLADFKLPYTFRVEDHGLRTAVLSPDGKQILTSDSAGNVIIWDTTKKPFAAYTLPPTSSEPTTQAQFSPDGSDIITMSLSKMMLWHKANNTWLHTPLDTKENVVYASFTPDGKKIAAAYASGSWALWKFNGSSWVEETPVPEDILSEFSTLREGSGFLRDVKPLVFDNNGKYLLTLRKEKDARVVELWNPESHVRQLRYEYDEVRCAAFSPDSTLIAMGGFDGHLKIFRSSDIPFLFWAPIADVGVESSQAISDVAFSEDGSRIVVTSGRVAKIFAVVSIGGAVDLSLVASLDGHDDDITSAFFLTSTPSTNAKPESHFVLTASKDHTIKIWEASCGRLLATLSGHRGEITSAVFDPVRSYVLSASEDSTAKIWDISDIRVDTTQLDSVVRKLKEKSPATTECPIEPSVERNRAPAPK